jgi:Fe2+ or Zn2+ uptake regulation protein
MTDAAFGTLSDAPLSDRLRARGWRITPQRRAIPGALAGEQVHLGAEQVHAAARRTVSKVSPATVYKTLNELVRLAEVSEINWLMARPATTQRSDPNITISSARGAA